VKVIAVEEALQLLILRQNRAVMAFVAAGERISKSNAEAQTALRTPSAGRRLLPEYLLESIIVVIS